VVTRTTVAELGWYPDPSGRHEKRFYDGTRWTDHVADGESIGVDPIQPPPASTAQQPLVMQQTEPMVLVPRPSVAGRAATRYKGWPLWAKIAAPVGAIALIGGVANTGDDGGGETPRGVVDVVATTVAEPTVVDTTTEMPTTIVVTTTVAPVVATTAAPPSTAAPTLPPTTKAPTPTSPPATQAPPPPATEAPSAPDDFVTPGAFCTPEGATGSTSTGLKMICSSTNAEGEPYGEGRNRWRRA
jgi:hypothetical protein